MSAVELNREQWDLVEMILEDHADQLQGGLEPNEDDQLTINEIDEIIREIRTQS